MEGDGAEIEDVGMQTEIGNGNCVNGEWRLTMGNGEWGL